MFSYIRNRAHWLFPVGGLGWLKARPQDLSGPTPEVLKSFVFLFRLDADEGLKGDLGVEIPLPPYQSDRDFPSIGKFDRPVLEIWRRPKDDRMIVVDSGKLGVEECTLVENKLFWYAGSERFPWRFAYCDIWIGVGRAIEGVDFTLKNDVVEMYNLYNKKSDAIPPEGIPSLPPVYPDGGILSLDGAKGLRFRSRLLEKDQVREWSADGKSWAVAKERDVLIIPMSPRRALYLEFVMRCANEPPRRWRSRALQIIDAIMSGMKFSGSWPDLK